MFDRLTKFHHVGVVVQDLEKSVAWHKQHPGFERLTDFSFPGARVAFIGRGELKLEFFQVDRASPFATERKEAEPNLTIGGINHFAIVVEDIDATVAKPQAKGVELAYTMNVVPDGSGDRWTFIRDTRAGIVT